MPCFSTFSFYLCNRKTKGNPYSARILPIMSTGKLRRDARVVEEARLESVYTPKGYRGFESPSLRKKRAENQ